MPMFSEEEARRLMGGKLPPKPPRTVMSTFEEGESPLERSFETLFKQYCNSRGMETPQYVREYRFDEGRKYKMDFAFVGSKVYVECEGRCHMKEDRYGRDVGKYNLASSQGWLLFRCVQSDLDENPFALMKLIVNTIRR